MPNYIRTQNPWVAAAEAVNGAASPLAQLYSQLPQVRAQMQMHADQMGIQQGRLNLDQQELGAKVPVYNAQAGNYSAEANKHNQETANLAQLLQLSQLVQNGATNLPQLAASSALLSPDSAQRMRADVTKPLTLNANETAFTNPEMGSPSPLAQGIVNAPFGNTVLGGLSLGETNQQPTVIQQGQFRPPGSMQIDPTTAAKNLAEVITAMDKAGMTEEDIAPILQVMMQRAVSSGGGMNMNTQTAGGDRVKVVGPNGEKGTVPKTSQLPQGWKIVQ